MPVAIAETTRGGITESVHHGAVVAVDVAGEVIAWCDEDHRLLPLVRQAVPGDPVIESGATKTRWLHPRRAGALLCVSRRLT